MHKGLYFDGRQIKNYLVGFASLFAEIPYKDRNGNLKIVPIHYGSPSDVISYLENNVDNAATANRNRIKDVSIPMFSFRMTGIEKNNEKRRAPHDTLTVDLRPLGYNTGYVAMRPSPYKFTMELVCWASSDYQAFEITEQIIPYFNSPQQVKIEPLPRCPVSTTEIFLDNIEIDTEPESQKYSALITMTFSLTGFILSQPKIWSTNMAFELSMLTDNIIDTTPDDSLFKKKDWSVGHDIRDLNISQSPIIPENLKEKFSDLESFIKNTPELYSEYADTLAWYNILVENNRINLRGDVIDTSLLISPYKDGEKIFYAETIMLVADKINDIRYIYENDRVKLFMKSNTLDGNFGVLYGMYVDKTDTINIFLKLLDNNLVTKNFNTTNVPVQNVDKMRIFGTSRINSDDVLNRLKNYLAALENIKIYKQALIIKGVYANKLSLFRYLCDIDYDKLPVNITNYIGIDLFTNDLKLEIEWTLNRTNTICLTLPGINIVGYVLIETPDGIVRIDFITDENCIATIDIAYEIDKSFGVIVVVDGFIPSINGIIVRDITNEFDYLNYEYNIFGSNDFIRTGVNNGQIVPFYHDENFFKLSKFDTLLDNKFSELDDYIVCLMTYNLGHIVNTENNELITILKNKYSLNYGEFIMKAIELKHLLYVSKYYIKNNENTEIPHSNTIPGNEYYLGQQNVSSDLSQTVATDNDGRPIYDANRDGIIDLADLTLLGANVDDPQDYYFELIYGVWHKKFRIDTMSTERYSGVMVDIKTILYILEKESYDEIADFLLLVGKKLVTSDFNLYSVLPDSDKSREIKALGYDLTTIENKLLVLRMFINSVSNIILHEKDFIKYKLQSSDENIKKLLYGVDSLNIDRLAVGKYLHMYFNTFQDDDARKENASIIKPFLEENLSYYMDYYVVEFDILINAIFETTLFNESMKYHTGFFEEYMPDINQKLINKYPT